MTKRTEQDIIAEAIGSYFTEAKRSLVDDDGDVIEHEGGFIDVHTSPQFAPRKQSVINFQVPEEHRGKGIGDALVKRAKEKHKDLGAQVSSLASLKVFHNNGFRNPSLPSGSFEDHKKAFHDNAGSLFLAHNDEHGNPYVS